MKLYQADIGLGTLVLTEDFEDALGVNWTETSGARENSNSHNGSWSYDNSVDDDIQVYNSGDVSAAAEFQITVYMKPTAILDGKTHNISVVLGDTTSAPDTHPSIVWSYVTHFSTADKYSLSATNSGGSSILSYSSTTQEGVTAFGTESKYVGFRLKVQQAADTNWYVYTYIDSNDDGTFSLLNAHVLSAAPGANYNGEFAVDANANATTYQAVYIDDIAIEEPSGEPGKIADIVSGECSTSGPMRVRIRDNALATWSTYEDYLWDPVTIYNDALTKVLWEGFITRIVAEYNHVTFHGQTYLNILDRVPADHNGILATGKVTSTADDYIDDSNAAFTAALVGKYCTFSDTTGPDQETVNPNSSSETYESNMVDPLAPTYEHYDYTEMATQDGYWSTSVAHNNYAMILEFTCPNAGTTTAFEFTVTARFQSGATYTDQPKLQILYDPTDTAVWTTVVDPLLPNANPDTVTYTFNNSDLTDTDASNYFNGTTIKIAIVEGQHPTIEKIIGKFAECVNTYSTAFNASGTVYTIDAQTATRLTFTGQTPNADGVAEKDIYTVGDYLHTELETIWDENGASIDWCALDVEDATIIDASDHRGQYVGNVIRRYATLMGCEVWQAPTRTIHIKSSFADTEIDLTEADLVTHPLTHEGWTWTHEGSNMIEKAVVLGAGVYAKKPQSIGNCPCGRIISDTSITSQYLGEQLATKALSEAAAKEVLPVIRLDMDTGSYDAIEPYRTIDGTFYSAALSFTAAKIKEIHYSQTRNSNLYADLILEE